MKMSFSAKDRCRYLACIFLMTVFPWYAFAAQKISGKVQDSAGVGLPSISVSLLSPLDSTFAFFDITNAGGQFDINVTKDGTYLLQVAALGYNTYYREITVPLSEPELTIVLAENTKGRQLAEVTIKGERVPVRVKGDTLEYDAAAFTIKPGGVVEDLLRKLPGVDVDKDGNVTSMGKAVKKVLVDGKAFFANDPKLATKNLPADAISKVQAFESKSQGSLFSGLDDGQREQTLNLVLKEDKKKGVFGSAEAGGGIQNKYEGTLKAFKFRKKTQLAALGMLNNINKFGFSIQDYINFSGGIGAMLQNGGGQISLDASGFPVDVGQPVPGDISSAALGLNYTIEPQSNSRVNISYLGNGLEKILNTNNRIVNYLPSGSYETQSSGNNEQNQLNNGLNINWRQTVNSSYQIEAQLYGQVASGKRSGKDVQSNFQDNVPVSLLGMQSDDRNRNNKVGGRFDGIIKTHGQWSLLKSTISIAGSDLRDGLGTLSQMKITSPLSDNTDSLYRDNRQKILSAEMEISAVRPLKHHYYLEASISVAVDEHTAFRMQGTGTAHAYEQTDSLTARFYRNVMQYKGALSLQRNKENERWTIKLSGDVVQMRPVMEGMKPFSKRTFCYLLPYFYWQRDLSRGQRITTTYQANISLPDALQMIPVADYSNPLMVVAGNPALKPEYHHHLDAGYTMFDEFNLSSLFVTLSGDYIVHKIGWAQTVFNDLSSLTKTINTPSGASAMLSTGYGRPIPVLGVKFRFSMNENWQLGDNMINDVANRCRSLTHKLMLDLSNRNQDQWQAGGGFSYALTSSGYSVNKERNTRYHTLDVFGNLSYQPVKTWDFSVHADGTYYNAYSFGKPFFIPLVNLEISRYLFQDQRGSLSLRVFDLLDKNKSIQRFSQTNQLWARQSNIIHRYAMLTFSYRFNRYGASDQLAEER